MSDGYKKEKRSNAIAAAIILLVVGALIYYMPIFVLWLAGYSPWLGVAAGGVIVCALFIIFWLRARYQKRRQRPE